MALNSTDSLSLAGSYFAQSLTMSGSQIERHLDLGGVHCAGKLDLEGLEVKGSLFMDSKHNQRAQFAEVVLDSARIGGRLSLRWACCTGKIDLHSARIGGRLSLRETHFKRPLDLHNVQIGGHLNLDNARCTGKLDLHNVQIGGDLDLRRARFKGPLDLHNARIGGDLYLHYAHFKGLLNLTGASLRGELHLGEGNKAMPQWNMDAQLVLRNATLRAIQCPPELKAWPAKLELGGCTYQQLGGSSSADPGADMAGRPPKWFIDWLASDQTFSPQPYQQLASVLRSMGHAETADAVLYQGKERERRDMGWRSLKWWGMSLLNWTIGYGYGYRYLLVRQVKSGSLGEEDLTPP